MTLQLERGHLRHKFYTRTSRFKILGHVLMDLKHERRAIMVGDSIWRHISIQIERTSVFKIQTEIRIDPALNGHSRADTDPGPEAEP
jgi:hypothetical protein